MSGYTGDCDIITVFSPDGQYVYTSDMVTLKKWDLATRKVVSEITPFPYKIMYGINNTNLIKVSQKDRILLYDLESQSVFDQEKPIQSEAAKKTLDKLKKGGYVYVFKGNNNVAALYSKKTLYRLDLQIGKLTEIGSDIEEPIAIPGTTLLAAGQYLFDFAAGKKVTFSSKGYYDVMLSPDQKYFITMGYNREAVFLDVSTGKPAFNAGTGIVKFKSDGTGFFVTWTKDEEGGKIEQIAEYTYPGFKQVRVIQDDWLVSGWRSYYRMMLDPDKEQIYRHIFDTKIRNMFVYGYDLKTGAVVDTVSFKHNPNAAEADVENMERVAREKIGNNALEKLADLKAPPFAHSINVMNSQFRGEYTDDGLVLLYDRYHQGQVCILWSFPEGKPVHVYSDEMSSQNGAPEGAIVVPGQIHRNFLSPTGKHVGFNSYNNAYVYEGNTQKVKLENSEIAVLLDGRAFVWSLNTKGERKSLSFVDTGTGKVLKGVKSSGIDFSAESHLVPGKAFFRVDNGLGVWDSASPDELKYYSSNEISKSGYPQFSTDVTKTDLKPTDRWDLSKTQSSYVINYYSGEGFVIYDFIANKRVNEKTLYSGWTKLNDVVYFKKLNKLLVITQSPLLTWPKPKPDAPGASAYTIDVKTNEITPYLLTDTRAEYVKVKGDPENIVYTYREPESDCERMARKFKVGQYLESTLAGEYKPYIVVGYDCERKVYVMAQRQNLFPNSNTVVWASRLVPVKEAYLESGRYRWVDIHYEICSACNGYPAGFNTEYYSGWSEWEQKSLNIHVYTRKWETTKKQVLQLCSVCNGQAWVK